MGGGWKRGATTVDAKDPGGETPGVSAKTYRRATPPRQSSTLLRYGNSARRFAAITGYLRMRLALVVSKRHQRSRGYGRSVVFFRSPNHLGLVGLDGIVAPPRPFRAWRVTPNAGGERRR